MRIHLITRFVSIHLQSRSCICMQKLAFFSCVPWKQKACFKLASWNNWVLFGYFSEQFVHLLGEAWDSVPLCFFARVGFSSKWHLMLAKVPYYLPWDATSTMFLKLGRSLKLRHKATNCNWICNTQLRSLYYPYLCMSLTSQEICTCKFVCIAHSCKGCVGNGTWWQDTHPPQWSVIKNWSWVSIKATAENLKKVAVLVAV